MDRGFIFSAQFHEEESLLSAEKLVEWKKKNKLYNFTHLPGTAIISAGRYPFSLYQRFRYKPVHGITGNHRILSSRLLFSSNYGIGAASVFNLLEELRILGIRRFIFVGFAGMIRKTTDPSSVYFIASALSMTGLTDYYSPDRLFRQQGDALSMDIRNLLHAKAAKIVSVDTPFRETKSLVDFARAQQADLIDMETSAVYLFAGLYQVEAVSIIIPADALIEKWTPPVSFDHMKKFRSIQEQLIHKFK